MAGETIPARKWNYREIQHTLDLNSFSDADPILRVNVLAIRDRLAKFRDKNHDTEPPNKSARTSFPIQGSVSLTIWTSASSVQETVVEQTRRCTIERKPKTSGERYASVELVEPFIIRLSQFRTRQLKKVPSPDEQTFSMQLIVTAATAQEEWPPVETRMAPPKKPYMHDTGGLVVFPLLVAKWQRLPRCPETEQESILEITATQDGGRYKPKLSLKIDACWCEPTSPLTRANREFKSRLSAEHSSVPPRLSPAPSEDQIPNIVVTTEWDFEGLSDFLPRNILDGYVCALCNNREFSDSGILHFHIHNNHDLFSFKFDPRFRRNSLGQTLIDVTIKANIATNYEGRAANTVGDFRDMFGEKPKTPFDLEAFLKGDQTWIGKRRIPNQLTPLSRLDPSKSSSREPLRPEPDMRAQPRPADQIPDLAEPRRKTYRAPPAPPGKHFYRLQTKREVHEGEVLSESDNDIDEDWLVRRHVETVAGLPGLRPAEKEFIQRFDRHMLTEAPSCNVHAVEAIMRFCRRNKAWLAREDMKLEFHKKAAALRLQGSLSWATIAACSKIIGEAEEVSEDSQDMMDLDDPAAEEPVLESPESPFEHLFGKCSECGDGVLDLRQSIRCAFLGCRRPDHHLDCIDKTAKDLSWICNDCRDAGVTELDLPARLRPKVPQPQARELPIVEPPSPTVETVPPNTAEVAKTRRPASAANPVNDVGSGERADSDEGEPEPEPEPEPELEDIEAAKAAKLAKRSRQKEKASLFFPNLKRMQLMHRE